MQSEFDPRKSKKNKEKHGIDFVEAQKLWENEERLEIEARSDDEPRFALIAMAEGKVWSAFLRIGERNVSGLSLSDGRERKKSNCIMKAKELDRLFDKGEDITPYLDLMKARRPGHEQRRVNVDFPNWMIDSLDRQASRLGVTRQSVIKTWIAERLEKEGKGWVKKRSSQAK